MRIHCRHCKRGSNLWEIKCPYCHRSSIKWHQVIIVSVIVLAACLFLFKTLTTE